MLFNSVEFSIFFPIVTILFFIFPQRFRWALLLFASCFFYMFFIPIYIFILIITIFIDYFAGIWIYKTQERKKKKHILLLSIFANVGVLVIFKYYNFIVENINIVSHSISHHSILPIWNIILPIGLSFHTFQAMSYTIEVYRGRQKPERHLGIYALYVMFYPQLVAGPIERPQNMLHQFHERKKFEFENVRSGLVLMAWGLFKKVVIADRLAFFVNNTYNDPFQSRGIPLITSTIFFAFQIFCDFSGYSDIALGSAKCMGFTLMNNFDRPYRSTSFGEFWQRWHISLSTWFRDYVYFPLGGNRVSQWRWYLNIMIVFMLSGIWHGANWTFVFWGFLNGIYFVIENRFQKMTPSLQKVHGLMMTLLKRSIIFLFITFSWIFFRAQNLGSAFYIIKHLFSNIPEQIRLIVSNRNYSRMELLYINQSSKEFLVAIFSIAAMIVIHSLQKKDRIDDWIKKKGIVFRWSFYYAIVLAFIFFGIFNRTGFIYFQF
jgi:alginate O-acetyltransferase complex protein AlgI